MPHMSPRIKAKKGRFGPGGLSAPVVTITSPADGDSFAVNTAVTFTGTATDDLQGDISSSIVWTSDVDGTLGTGASVSFTFATAGPRVITATATDAGGNSGSDSITITVA